MAALSALGVFSRTEQRVLQAIFKAIVDGDGCCVATLANGHAEARLAAWPFSDTSVSA
jgi:hypothetical protein